ncbi:hypothetical protein LXL04_026894 [Taraxacum kok-saghyz]
MHVHNVTKLRDLDPQKLDFIIKVRVLKKWNIPSRYNENEVWLTEMILMDEEGDVIQATLSKNLFYKFQTQLREGSDYLIASPTLGEQNINFLPCQQK